MSICGVLAEPVADVAHRALYQLFALARELSRSLQPVVKHRLRDLQGASVQKVDMDPMGKQFLSCLISRRMVASS